MNSFLRLFAPVLPIALVVAACGGPAASPTATAASVVPSVQAETSPTPSRAPVASAPVASAPSAAPSVSPLPALTLLWQAGGPHDATPGTWWPAVNPKTGDVWVAASSENLFWILSPSGKYLRSWGTGGAGPGQFDFNDHAQNPDGFGAIAFAADGSFYVGDVGNHRVEKFDSSRRYIEEWGAFGSGDGQFAQIVSIATDGKTVYVGDGDRYDVQAFDSNGTFRCSFGADGQYNVTALDQAGNIWASSPTGIAEFDQTGKQLTTIDTSFTGGDAFGLTIDKSGELYVSINDHGAPYANRGIYQFNPAGQLLRAWSSGADAITLDPQGDAVYGARIYGGGLDGWAYIRKYALPKV